jgi:hypothetical protein
MAKGKQLGEFSVKFTSFTLTPGPAGSTLVQGNFEGSTTSSMTTGYGVSWRVANTTAFMNAVNLRPLNQCRSLFSSKPKGSQL